MTLRRRITLVGAAAVAVAVALACTTAYFVVRAELFSQVDSQLRQQAATIERFARMFDRLAMRELPPGAEQMSQLSPQQGGPLAYVQVLTRDGRRGDAATFALPIDAVDRDVAAGRRGAVLRDRNADDVALRILTVPIGERGAVQLARPMNSIHDVLEELRLILILVCIGGVALAALLARVVTRRLTAPLRTVAEAADHIGETDDLARRIDATSEDEVGQLARRFNGMLDRLQASRDALAGSVAAQRQLVADASHELRTPITSVRTNLEVLAASELAPAAREQLLSELIEQTEDLGALVADVIELARGDADPDAIEDVRLDEVTAAVVESARRHHRHVAFVVHAEPVVLDGARDRLGRAVSNLLDNAAKHSAPGGSIEVTVDTSGVRIRDHGPGIADADLPHLFDRFYRGATARRLPGTGLGLAIVQQVAQAHGGSVEVRTPDGGGAEFQLRLEARAVGIHGHSLA